MSGTLLVVPLLLLLRLEDPAEADYQRGMALAREQRWEEARQALEAGRSKAPSDQRFPLELAGIAFKQKDYPAAKDNLRVALDLDPNNAYAADFLGTVYLLEGNTEAALKYWNRIGKPRVEQVRLEPRPAVDPVLLDRAFAFSPAAVMRLEQYRATQARLGLLDIFSAWQFELLPGGGRQLRRGVSAARKEGLALAPRRASVPGDSARVL